MTTKQVEMFESVAGQALKKYDYELVTDGEKLSKLETTFWKLHNQFYRLFHLIKINTIDWVLIKYFGKEPFAE